MSKRLTNRWSSRLKWSSVSYKCRRCGSLRACDSAAQLNSMLDGCSGLSDQECSTVGASSIPLDSGSEDSMRTTKTSRPRKTTTTLDPSSPKRAGVAIRDDAKPTVSRILIENSELFNVLGISLALSAFAASINVRFFSILLSAGAGIVAAFALNAILKSIVVDVDSPAPYWLKYTLASTYVIFVLFLLYQYRKLVQGLYAPILMGLLSYIYFRYAHSRASKVRLRQGKGILLSTVLDPIAVLSIVSAALFVDVKWGNEITKYMNLFLDELPKTQ